MTVSEQTPNVHASPVKVTIKNGERYAFRVQARDPAPYNILSPWSAWCEFYPDTTKPKEPVITWSNRLLQPGEEVVFTISTPSLDVTTFRYGFKAEQVREVAATLTTATNGSQAKTAQVKMSTTKYGESIFTAFGIDGTLNEGHRTSVSLLVNKPVTAVARYGLQTYPESARSMRWSTARGPAARTRLSPPA